MNSRHVPSPVPSPAPSPSPSQPTEAGISRRLIRGFAGLLALVLLSAIFASACGTSSATTTAATTAARTYAATTAAAMTTAAGTAAGGYSKNGSPATTTVPPYYTNSTIAPSSGSRPSEFDVKVIRNAALALEAKNAEQTYRDLLAFAAARGGYEASYRMSASTGGALIEARIKLPPKSLDEFMNYAGTAARVLSATTTSEDVTESYYDAQTRLHTLEQMLTKYTEFLSKAANINEALSVQSEINRLTAEIESLKGKLRYYDSMVAESTVSLTIKQEEPPVIIQETKPEIKEVKWNALTTEDMGKLMQRGFMSVVNSLTSVLQWIAIFLVSVAPLLFIGLIVLIILWLRRRRHPRPPHDSGWGGRRGSYGEPTPPAGTRSGLGASGAAGPAGSESSSNRVVPVEHWGRAAKAQPDQQKADIPPPAITETPPPETLEPGAPVPSNELTPAITETPPPETQEPAAPVPSNEPPPDITETPPPDLPEPDAREFVNGAAPLEIPDRSDSEPSESPGRSR